MKKYKKSVFLVGLIFFCQTAFAELLLFSDDQTFHGCMDCGSYDSSSVCNKYGNYGNKYSSDSIWSKYGAGNKYNNESPFSKYGSGLKVVDRQGGFYGYLSRSYGGDPNMRKFLNDIWEITGGDYDEMRDIFCDNF
tara:strand:+ start:238 stop:645 length:408 start_codon:yes stop_codon:yes gene_type:complete